MPLRIEGGTDDEKSAYRWKPVCADHRRFSNIAYFDRRVGRVRFLTLHGHAFGLAPAVLNYNRQPELLVAVMRCLLETSCLHFYDDHLTLEPSSAHGSGQWAYRELCKLLNVHLDEDKHTPRCRLALPAVRHAESALAKSDRRVARHSRRRTTNTRGRAERWAHDNAMEAGSCAPPEAPAAGANLRAAQRASTGRRRTSCGGYARACEGA